MSYIYTHIYMGVSKNRVPPQTSILIWFLITNHPFWGTPIVGNTHLYTYVGVFFNTKKASNLTTPTTRPLHRGGDFPEQRVAVGASSGESLRKEGVFWVVCVFFFPVASW